MNDARAATRAIFGDLVLDALVRGDVETALDHAHAWAALPDATGERLPVTAPQPPPRTPGRNYRVTDELLQQVAALYRKAIPSGKPTRTIAETYGITVQNAAKWVGRARQAGHLGAAVGPTAGEQVIR